MSARAIPTVSGRIGSRLYRAGRDGFRVTFTRRVSVDRSGACIPVVTSSTPAPSSVRPGFTVILWAKIPTCGAASPGHAVPLPGPNRVPSSGKAPIAAIKWIHVTTCRRRQASLPCTTVTEQPVLDYVIHGQSPRPGSVHGRCHKVCWAGADSRSTQGRSSLTATRCPSRLLLLDRCDSGSGALAAWGCTVAQVDRARSGRERPFVVAACSPSRCRDRVVPPIVVVGSIRSPRTGGAQIVHVTPDRSRDDQQQVCRRARPITLVSPPGVERAARC